MNTSSIADTRQVAVLHVGGVGTNALINSTLLNERGYISHVAANDIYHCICSPEWQELGSKGMKREDLGDDFFPNFFRFSESAEVRPRWFAQGPQLTTIFYLFALRSGDAVAADGLWRTLQYQRFKAVLLRTTAPETVRLDERAFDTALRSLAVADIFRDDLHRSFVGEKLIARFADVAARLNGHSNPEQFVAPFSADYIDAIARHDDALAAEIASCRVSGEATLIGLERPDWSTFQKAAIASQFEDKSRPRRSSRALLRRNAVKPDDAAVFGSVMGDWNALLGVYDHRILYGGSAVIGLLSDVDQYMAYEHGTIRSLPFDPSSMGRLTRAAYEQADAVFITNTDYVSASRRLEFEPERRVYVPHAFDERPLLALAEQRGPTVRMPGPIRLFGPARQDWVLNDPMRSKANHLVVEAAAQVVASGEHRFEVTFVAWGDDVAATKALIAERGLGQHFHWVEPLARNDLWQRYLDVDAVVDQFLISGLSGVTYEALTLGCRIITKDDGICNKEFFGEAPPFMPAATASEIARHIHDLIADPDDKRGIGRKSQAWALAYHSGARFVALQESQFERLAVAERAAHSAAAIEREDPVFPDSVQKSFARLGSYFWPIASNARNSAAAIVGIRSSKR